MLLVVVHVKRSELPLDEKVQCETTALYCCFTIMPVQKVILHGIVLS